MLMCRLCGEFIRAIPDGDTLLPKQEKCPDCGGTEFKDNESGRIIRLD